MGKYKNGKRLVFRLSCIIFLGSRATQWDVLHKDILHSVLLIRN